MQEEKENTKFKQIAKTAKDLFWRFGIRRVTIEEICRTAGVSKMTFYKYFDNKIELAKYIYNKVMSEAEKEYSEIKKRDIPFSEKVKLSIKLKLKQGEDLSQEFINELLLNEVPEITELYHRKMKENLQGILKDYTLAQKKGDIRRDIKPEFILYFLSHLTQMFTDKHLISLYESPRAVLAELINFFFYGILPRESVTGEKDAG